MSRPLPSSQASPFDSLDFAPLEERTLFSAVPMAILSDADVEVMDPHLDEVALEYFATNRARQIVRNKVATLFPDREVERFTDHFWGLIQFWRKTEADRLGIGS